MGHSHDNTPGAEHPGFLQKIKDKLHIGGHHKDKGVAADTTSSPTDTAISSRSIPPPTETPSAASPMKEEPSPSVEEEPAKSKPPPVEVQPRDATTDLSSLAGHEGEHHGGTPTFLAALPDKDIPDEETMEKLHHVTVGQAATPKDLASPGGEFFDSEEVFSKAQQGEHHGGTPTFLSALPEQDIPDEATKDHLHHVTAGEATAALSPTDLDSEKVFSDAQEGEHHGGVPTFLVALPDQEIPGEVNKEASSDVAGKDADGSGAKPELGSDEAFSTPKLEHRDLPGEDTKQ